MSENKPKGQSGKMWGILNPSGDLWTYRTFGTPGEARKHIADFWRQVDPKHDITKFRVVLVNVRVTAVYPLKEPSDV